MSRSREIVQVFFAAMSSADPLSIGEILPQLDELILAYHYAPDGTPSDSDLGPPTFDQAKICEDIAERFPYLGNYHTIDDTTVPPTILSSDAVDDLSDVIIDLMKFTWRFDHLGPEDAYWNLKFDFCNHWGLHLRELALYLNKKTFYA